MIIRWDPALIKFIELSEFIEDTMTIDLSTVTKRIEEVSSLLYF